MVDDDTRMLDESGSPPPPLRRDEQGCLRVGDTRVRLDTVVYEFNTGATPEEIVLEFGSLSLAQVSATISVYLQHKEVLDEYLARRTEQADVIRLQLSSGVAELRDKLLRRAGMAT